MNLFWKAILVAVFLLGLFALFGGLAITEELNSFEIAFGGFALIVVSVIALINNFKIDSLKKRTDELLNESAERVKSQKFNKD